ncbi:Type II secretion system protein G [Moorella glycerini]|uniref:Type II secretion system protein G n=1 Tax=Neomoorella stamsii TaxID=1266720 RepID=A0A9X7J5N2_9FIRM|nr:MULTISPECIES: type II secretion system protein GspG [Moorella]PRR77749.1 Type II secretion system protein G precursor [Moorella stamsii]CEP66034.1 Type II secretion system protein G [Moorella glycerini]
MMKRIREMLHDRKGFTLIELMVVVVIIGILAAIAVPQFMGQSDKAKISKAKADLKTIGSAIELYYTDNGALPPEGSNNTLDANALQNYLKTIPQDPWGGNYYYDKDTNYGHVGFTLKDGSNKGIYYPPN